MKDGAALAFRDVKNLLVVILMPGLLAMIGCKIERQVCSGAGR